MVEISEYFEGNILKKKKIPKLNIILIIFYDVFQEFLMRFNSEIPKLISTDISSGIPNGKLFEYSSRNPPRNSNRDIFWKTFGEFLRVFLQELQRELLQSLQPELIQWFLREFLRRFYLEIPPENFPRIILEISLKLQ